ncbi:MAG: tRNA (adenosine(37)-N6)-threonylcarbamoyltransferase complex ATPase subunit type 1 TsaE [Candidatus Margulisiibacteriota bacterium]
MPSQASERSREELQTITNTGSPKETRKLGIKLGKGLKAGDTVALFGDLGSGKTTFVQGVAEGLGIQGFVTSPSFVIINEYRTLSGLPFYHIDLYRTDSLSQIEDLGISDLFGKGSIVLIEWAEKALGLLPENCRRVRFELISENERRITTDESARH